MPSTDSDSKRPKTSAKRRSLLPLLIFFITVLLVASGVLIYLVRNHLEAAAGVDSTARLSAQNGFLCEYSEAQKLYPFADGVVKVTSSRVAYLSMVGTEIFSIDIKMDNPFCVIRGEYALVADSGGYFCMLLSAKGEVYTKQMKGSISFGELSEEGYVGLIIEQQDTKGSVYLMDNTGNFLAQWNSVESGYPVAVSFSPDMTFVDIALVDTDGSSIQPRLKQIELPTEDLDKKPKDRALYTPGVVTILSSIAYIGSDKTVLSGISDLLCFSGDEVAVISSFGQIFSVFSAGDGVAVIYSDGIGQEVKMEYINSDFSRGSSIVVGNIFIDAKSREGKVAIAVDDKILMVDAASLKTEKSIIVDQEVIKIGFNDEGIVVVTVDSVREITF